MSDDPRRDRPQGAGSAETPQAAAPTEAPTEAPGDAPRRLRGPGRRGFMALGAAMVAAPFIASSKTSAATSTEVLAKITDAALSGQVIPGHRGFATAAQALAEAAAGCAERKVLRAAFHRAFDEWMGVSHLRFGPAEAEGRALAIEFWPDPRGFVRRSVDGLLAQEDPAVDDADAFREVSVAGRGLMAAERLLFDADAPDVSVKGYPCRLLAAVTADLARTAQELRRDWEESHAPDMRKAATGDGAIYRSVEEPPRALYTALMGGARMTAEKRLGEPLGSYDRPWPTKAEAWRSGRSLRNVELSLQALTKLADCFAPALAKEAQREQRAAWDRALEVARRAPAPLDRAVTDPNTRFAVESVQSAIDTARERFEHLAGPAIGISPGFNALDGD
ncbi:imelysin family protein [Albimonas sp. CAU 1670]|uniref:imelysin family protein n=1 Tax=Albimonas sp. CAU 1670 TaxID=3032599 RepID=UPI0023DC7EB5|nr:imelysin family protein [Albimonas sp. CAU 1670]MDF2232305.1 imelysin family protein [Albimonas sp. CAU 1670]